MNKRRLLCFRYQYNGICTVYITIIIFITMISCVSLTFLKTHHHLTWITRLLATHHPPLVISSLSDTPLLRLLLLLSNYSANNLVKLLISDVCATITRPRTKVFVLSQESKFGRQWQIEIGKVE